MASRSAGQTDFAVLPRDPKEEYCFDVLMQNARVADFANRTAMGPPPPAFFRAGRNNPSASTDFDRRYRVLAATPHLLLDATIARRLLDWPDPALIHSVIAWRDPFAFRLHVPIHRPPDWAAVSYLISIGEDLVRRLPAPTTSAVPPGRFDRFLDLLIRN